MVISLVFISDQFIFCKIDSKLKKVLFGLKGQCFLFQSKETNTWNISNDIKTYTDMFFKSIGFGYISL